MNTQIALLADYLAGDVAERLDILLDTRADWLGALTSVYGDRIDDNLANKIRVFLSDLLAGRTPSASTLDMPQVVWLSDADMNSAQGGYSADENTIFLNLNLLDGAADLAGASDRAKARVSAILTQELGHAIEVLLGLTDTTGDEGDAFYRTVIGDQAGLAALDPNENDQGAVFYNGQWITVENARTLSDTNALDAHTVFFQPLLDDNADNEVGSPYNLGTVGEAFPQDTVITHDADGDGNTDYSLSIVKLGAFFELVITDLETQTYSVIPLSERIDFADGSGSITFDRVEGKLQAYSNGTRLWDQINLIVTDNGGVQIQRSSQSLGVIETPPVFQWDPSDEDDLSDTLDAFLGDRKVKQGPSGTISFEDWPLSEDEYLKNGSFYTRLVNFNDIEYISTHNQGTGKTTLHDISDLDFVEVDLTTKELLLTEENFVLGLSETGDISVENQLKRLFIGPQTPIPSSTHDFGDDPNILHPLLPETQLYSEGSDSRDGPHAWSSAVQFGNGDWRFISVHEENGEPQFFDVTEAINEGHTTEDYGTNYLWFDVTTGQLFSDAAIQGDTLHLEQSGDALRLVQEDSSGSQTEQSVLSYNSLSILDVETLFGLSDRTNKGDTLAAGSQIDLNEYLHVANTETYLGIVKVNTGSEMVIKVIKSVDGKISIISPDAPEFKGILAFDESAQALTMTEDIFEVSLSESGAVILESVIGGDSPEERTANTIERRLRVLWQALIDTFDGHAPQWTAEQAFTFVQSFRTQDPYYVNSSQLELFLLENRNDETGAFVIQDDGHFDFSMFDDGSDAKAYQDNVKHIIEDASHLYFALQNSSDLDGTLTLPATMQDAIELFGTDLHNIITQSSSSDYLQNRSVDNVQDGKWFPTAITGFSDIKAIQNEDVSYQQRTNHYALSALITSASEILASGVLSDWDGPSAMELDTDTFIHDYGIYDVTYIRSDTNETYTARVSQAQYDELQDQAIASEIIITSDAQVVDLVTSKVFWLQEALSTYDQERAPTAASAEVLLAQTFKTVHDFYEDAWKAAGEDADFKVFLQVVDPILPSVSDGFAVSFMHKALGSAQGKWGLASVLSKLKRASDWISVATYWENSNGNADNGLIAKEFLIGSDDASDADGVLGERERGQDFTLALFNASSQSSSPQDFFMTDEQSKTFRNTSVLRAMTTAATAPFARAIEAADLGSKEELSLLLQERFYDDNMSAQDGQIMDQLLSPDVWGVPYFAGFLSAFFGGSEKVYQALQASHLTSSPEEIAFFSIDLANGVHALAAPGMFNKEVRRLTQTGSELVQEESSRRLSEEATAVFSPEHHITAIELADEVQVIYHDPNAGRSAAAQRINDEELFHPGVVLKALSLLPNDIATDIKAAQQEMFGFEPLPWVINQRGMTWGEAVADNDLQAQLKFITTDFEKYPNSLDMMPPSYLVKFLNQVSQHTGYTLADGTAESGIERATRIMQNLVLDEVQDPERLSVEYVANIIASYQLELIQYYQDYGRPDDTSSFPNGEATLFIIDNLYELENSAPDILSQIMTHLVLNKPEIAATLFEDIIDYKESKYNSIDLFSGVSLENLSSVITELDRKDQINLTGGERSLDLGLADYYDIASGAAVSLTGLFFQRIYNQKVIAGSAVSNFAKAGIAALLLQGLIEIYKTEKMIDQAKFIDSVTKVEIKSLISDPHGLAENGQEEAAHKSAGHTTRRLFIEKFINPLKGLPETDPKWDRTITIFERMSKENPEKATERFLFVFEEDQNIAALIFDQALNKTPPGYDFVGNTLSNMSPSQAAKLVDELYKVRIGGSGGDDEPDHTDAIMAEMLSKMPPAKAAEIIRRMDEDTAARLLALMDPAAAANIYEELINSGPTGAAKAAKLFKKHTPEKREEILPRLTFEAQALLLNAIDENDGFIFSTDDVQALLEAVGAPLAAPVISVMMGTGGASGDRASAILHITQISIMPLLYLDGLDDEILPDVIENRDGQGNANITPEDTGKVDDNTSFNTKLAIKKSDGSWIEGAGEVINNTTVAVVNIEKSLDGFLTAGRRRIAAFKLNGDKDAFVVVDENASPIISNDHLIVAVPPTDNSASWTAMEFPVAQITNENNALEYRMQPNIGFIEPLFFTPFDAFVALQQAGQATSPFSQSVPSLPAPGITEMLQSNSVTAPPNPLLDIWSILDLLTPETATEQHVSNVLHLVNHLTPEQAPHLSVDDKTKILAVVRSVMGDISPNVLGNNAFRYVALFDSPPGQNAVTGLPSALEGEVQTMVDSATSQILSNSDLQSIFPIWDTLSEDDKFDHIRTIFGIIKEAYGLSGESIDIELMTSSDTTAAYYEHQPPSSNLYPTVWINPVYLRDISAAGIIATLAHEMFHAWQWTLIEDYSSNTLDAEYIPYALSLMLSGSYFRTWPENWMQIERYAGREYYALVHERGAHEVERRVGGRIAEALGLYFAYDEQVGSPEFFTGMLGEAFSADLAHDEDGETIIDQEHHLSSPNDYYQAGVFLDPNTDTFRFGVLSRWGRVMWDSGVALHSLADGYDGWTGFIEIGDNGAIVITDDTAFETQIPPQFEIPQGYTVEDVILRLTDDGGLELYVHSPDDSTEEVLWSSS
ncbi:MAG: hypothetical protein AAF228_11020 [Pseudomonadota bacterium]